MKARELPRPFQFPWGGGMIVEEVYVESTHHVPTVQLLEYEDGSLSVRFCSYSHSGRFQRNPMMASADDVEALGRALQHATRLRAIVEPLAPKTRKRA
jgi:hypothetical protein